MPKLPVCTDSTSLEVYHIEVTLADPTDVAIKKKETWANLRKSGIMMGILKLSFIEFLHRHKPDFRHDWNSLCS